MYPYLRLAGVLARAPFRSRLDVGAVGEVSLRAWLSDIDLYPEVNNGRHLTLMDLGRVDFALRTGLLRAAHEHGWALVIGGASVRFRHRLRPFRRFVVRTRLLGHDGRWFYLHQMLGARGRPLSSALLRGGLRSKEGLVAATTVLAAMNRADWAPALPDWVLDWIAADATSPWPPGLEMEPHTDPDGALDASERREAR